MAKKYKALGAYIFGGGFTLGMMKHFEVLAHFEETPYGVDTARLNLPKLPIHVGLDNWPIDLFRRVKPDVVYGNPPCAAWSALNGKKTMAEKSWRDDERVHCVGREFTLLEELRPKIWVWESVDRAFTTGREFVDDLARRAVELGYSVTHLRFDAQYVGGFHRRSRYFFVAHKVEFDWEKWVKFRDAPTVNEVLKLAKNVTPDDAKFVAIPSFHRAAYDIALPGEALQSAWDRLNAKRKAKVRVTSTGRSFIAGRPAFKNIKIAGDRVSPTIVGLNFFHPKKPRHLTFAEMKAICGYPPTFRMANNGRTTGAALGFDWDVLTRAVMPPIGDWLGGLCVKALDAGRSTPRRPKVEIVDLRKKTINVQGVMP